MSFIEGFLETSLALQNQQDQRERRKQELKFAQQRMKLEEQEQELRGTKLRDELTQRMQQQRAQSRFQAALMGDESTGQPESRIQGQPQMAAPPSPVAGMQFETVPRAPTVSPGGTLPLSPMLSDLMPQGIPRPPLTAPPNPMRAQAPQAQQAQPAPQAPQAGAEPGMLGQIPPRVRQLAGLAMQAGQPAFAQKILEPYLKQQEPTKLGPEEVLIGPGGKEIARGIGKQAKPPSTPFEALTAAGMDPYLAFQKLEEGREAARAKFREPKSAGMSVTLPDGTTMQVGGPTATGATKPLPAAEGLKLVVEAESITLGLQTAGDLEALVVQDPRSFGVGADIAKDVKSAVVEGVRGFGALAGLNQQVITGVKTDGPKAAELVARISTANTSRGQYLYDSLTIQQARINNPTGVLTDRDVEVAQSQIGGKFKSVEDFLPKMQEMKKRWRRQHESVQRKAASFPGLRITPLPKEADAAPGTTKAVTDMTTEELFQELGKGR